VPVRAVRGATQLEADERDHLVQRVGELVRTVLEVNRLSPDDLVSVVFTATQDVHSAFPAEGARSVGLTEVPLLCATEMEVSGSLERAIRMLAHVERGAGDAPLQHVYLHGAVVLRPDWTAGAAVEQQR